MEIIEEEDINSDEDDSSKFEKPEPPEEDKFYNNRSNLYAFSVLSILTLLRISFLWQRKSFNYIYGYKGDGMNAGNPFYEILSEYPSMDQYYGLLAGLAYNVPDSLAGICLTLLPEGFNRKFLLGFVAICSGLTFVTTGTVNSLMVLCLMRMAQAACNSVSNPLFFSITAEYFPRNKRGTANSFLQSANNIGIALSSLSILVISKFGWRMTYKIMGAMSLILGALSLVYIKEPRPNSEPLVKPKP